ncbi:MAG: hypothetical protein C5B55_07250 [Blastocatellia bacterium]|nr:MAG: hypothetical protein C5B55_07250 [Blastocatellia bacterium]
MNRKHLLSASALLLIGASAVLAQRPAAQGVRPTPTPAATNPQPAAPPTATGPVNNGPLPVSKMAVIDTDAFLDPKEGITKFNATLTRLNSEFQKVKDDLTGMQQRQAAAEGELAKLQQAPPGTPIDQNAMRLKSDQIDQLKKDIARKGEDAQTAYNKRRQELFSPLQEEVGRALEAFAKARGITVIIDASQVPLLYAADNTDITRAFIADFNSKNPVAAAPARP